MKHFLPALTFVLREFLKILLLPYNLYCKSIERLIETKESSALSIEKSSSNWPFLSFLKRLLLEFLFDAITLLVYPIGIIVFVAVVIQELFFRGLWQFAWCLHCPCSPINSERLISNIYPAN